MTHNSWIEKSTSFFTLRCLTHLLCIFRIDELRMERALLDRGKATAPISQRPACEPWATCAVMLWAGTTFLIHGDLTHAIHANQVNSNICYQNGSMRRMPLGGHFVANNCRGHLSCMMAGNCARWLVEGETRSLDDWARKRYKDAIRVDRCRSSISECTSGSL